MNFDFERPEESIYLDECLRLRNDIGKNFEDKEYVSGKINEFIYRIKNDAYILFPLVSRYCLESAIYRAAKDGVL